MRTGNLRIAARGPNASTRIPAGARIVRASGKFVIPGLWDMHVHVGAIEEDWFPLYLANGVTGLREMAASEENAPRQRQYEQNVANGRRVGPELFWTLFAMDAPRIDGARTARAEVARRAAMGLSYIKIYNGLSRESYFAIADECRKRGLRSGTFPIRSAQARSRGRDRLRWNIWTDSCWRARAGRRKPDGWCSTAGIRGRCCWTHSAKANALIDSFREGGVWQTPTLTIHYIGSLARGGQLPGAIPIQWCHGLASRGTRNLPAWMPIPHAA